MGEKRSNKQIYSDPTAAEAIGHVARECRMQKRQTSVDCFASRKGKCNVLNVKKCDSSSCGFYKTEEQIAESMLKTYKRIKSLDKPAQLHISESYYGGKMPWLKGGV